MEVMTFDEILLVEPSALIPMLVTLVIAEGLVNCGVRGEGRGREGEGEGEGEGGRGRRGEGGTGRREGRGGEREERIEGKMEGEERGILLLKAEH